MSDITKKIFSIEDADAPITSAPKSSLDLRPIADEPSIKFGDKVSLKPAPNKASPAVSSAANPHPDPLKVKPEPLITRLAPEKKVDTAPIMPRFIGRDNRPELEPVGHGLTITGSLLGLMTALAIGAWTYGYFELSQSGTTLSPFGYAALICAVIIPAVTVALLFFCLRALKQSRNEGRRLALITDRLMRIDEQVGEDVQRLSTAIRSELSSVDARLAQSQAGLEAFQSQLNSQSTEIDQQTHRVADRAETVGRAMILHRQALETLSETTDTQLAALSEQLDARRAAFEATAQKASSDIGAAQEVLGQAGEKVDASVERLRAQSEASGAALLGSTHIVQSAMDQSKETMDGLQAVYQDHAAQIDGFSSVLSEDQGRLDQALAKQAERLNAVDAQIEITDARLTALLDHAGSIQDALDARLDDIEITLGKADTHSQAFTRDMTDRVSDSIAQTRREMALMEAELRSLQARLSATQPLTLDLDIPEAPNSAEAKPSNRIHLKPLDTDFPPLDPPGASPDKAASVAATRAAPIEAPEPIAVKPRRAKTEAQQNYGGALDLTTFGEQDLTLPAPVADLSDVVRRPGQIDERRSPKAALSVEPAKKSKGWHWRDMLGRIDPLGHDEPSQDKIGQHTEDSRHEAAQPPQPIPPRPELPEGSDIVARLCEVQLAPSAIVDEGTIIDTTEALMTGGERVTDVVLRRLEAPITHLRGVLAADLEFKLLAENFSRYYGDAILAMENETDIRAHLGSASGRAFLLCAAALRT